MTLDLTQGTSTRRHFIGGLAAAAAAVALMPAKGAAAAPIKKGPNAPLGFIPSSSGRRAKSQQQALRVYSTGTVQHFPEGGGPAYGNYKVENLEALASTENGWSPALVGGDSLTWDNGAKEFVVLRDGLYQVILNSDFVPLTSGHCVPYIRSSQDWSDARTIDSVVKVPLRSTAYAEGNGGGVDLFPLFRAWSGERLVLTFFMTGTPGSTGADCLYSDVIMSRVAD